MFTWIVVFILTIVAIGRLADCSDDEIKLNVVASIPKHIILEKFRLEYELRSSFKENGSQEQKIVYKNCKDVPTLNGSGVYNISINGEHKMVYCEIHSDGTKYLVIQRRADGSEDFYRNWTDYENGFGNPNNEFWIGNKALHLITLDHDYKLRIELESADLNKSYAEYGVFSVGSSETKYKLNVSDYAGDAGDSFSDLSGQMFSTFDQDNDRYPGNCAAEFKGAWWYNSCHKSNLNGLYHRGRHITYADGVNWISFIGEFESLKMATMKIY